jgi:DnaJ like chaperone protein
LVRELHPDKHVANGMPQELVLIATERLARINEAFDRIKKEMT